MEPRKNESQKAPASPREEAKRRFQIVKLEERIAPACHTNPHGKYVGGCKQPPCYGGYGC